MERNFKSAVKEIRKSMISSIYKAKKGHIGGSLSCVDVIYYLFLNDIVQTSLKKNTKDSFILSKGHSSLALLAVINYINGNKYNKYLTNFNLDGSLSGNNCSELVPGFEFHTGSLGHGVSLGCGQALAKQFDKINGHTIIMLGDGELHEGSIMEGILFADHHKLNITIIIDNNKQLCEDFTNNVISVEKLFSFFKHSFNCIQINGNEISDLKKIKPFLKTKGLKIVIANTIKGNGVSFMEGKIKWHHSSPNEEEYIKAIKELN